LLQKTRFSHGTLGILQFAINTTEFFAVFDQHGPNAIEHFPHDLLLHRAVNEVGIAKLPGKLDPLAASGHLVVDAVKCRPRFSIRVTHSSPWVEIIEDVLKNVPQFGVQLPD
jgi:hypothetical protein